MCILEDTSADKTAVIFHPRVVWKLQRFFFFMIQMLPSFLLATSHSHSSKDMCWSLSCPDLAEMQRTF